MSTTYSTPPQHRAEHTAQLYSPMPDHQETRRLVGVIADKIADGTILQSGIYTRAALAGFVREALADMEALREVTQLHHRDDWRAVHGPVLWWRLPPGHTPYLGTPEDADFPCDVMHWTRLPVPQL